ncbi:hypothetical protein SAMN05216516_10633 [Izhakiella capsodis]|uniref:Uncharacterized protein n=1 Tax=Izhakiella capsodis TaxID=1367852 RepID=A0A1I4YCD3_9GAMM|nr:hypothetical protein SAMN05216516_10633 [Izhakiella capsodis]
MSDARRCLQALRCDAGSAGNQQVFTADTGAVPHLTATGAIFERVSRRRGNRRVTQHHSVINNARPDKISTDRWLNKTTAPVKAISGINCSVHNPG